MLANCDQQQVVIRIAEIDAPEKLQDFGLRSRQSLVELCLYKNAEIIPKNKNSFGYTIAYVNCGGNNAGIEQIKRGMAWVFDKYVTDMDLYAIQDQAKSFQKGIWQTSSPIPPWQWRGEE